MVSMTKLVLVTVLGGAAVFLGTLVLTFQVLLVQKRTRLLQRQQRHHQQQDSSGSSTKNLIDSTKPMYETRDLHLWKHGNKTTQSTVSQVSTAAQAYWNQVLPYIQQWDGVWNPNNDDETELLDSTSSLPPPSSHTVMALQEAARLGHSQAQYFYANALASGILPFTVHNHNMSLQVPLDIQAQHNDDATIQSHVYWHMAALDGHIASAMNLGYRRAEQPQQHESSCEAALPYYQEAAHGILDALEQSKHSRAKIPPAMDTHVLPEVYVKGSSQQSWHNQPDEPQDALQYYEMRAPSDVQAAYTLAHLHHYGIRGVSQNLTLALHYYDMAAAMGHVEAAGQAGKFHLWGIGMEWKERNLVKAQAYFQQGIEPYGGYEGCKKRFRDAQRMKRLAMAEADLCDHAALNGMGVLLLVGMPLLLPVNVELATKYLELARDMGNMDASYNLAMMRLGYKTRWTTLDSLDDDDDDSKMAQSKSLPMFLIENSADLAAPTKADYLVALQELVSAANKGHLQARHYLGILYSKGVKSPDKSTTIIARDCSKALKHFSWIAQTANPHLSHHTRRAYKHYTAGNYEASLYNYLASAEMGDQVSQVNAAFLLEQGTCLSLTPQQCAAASLRLWKAAVQNSPEAAMRVGDVYFYGRLRDTLANVGPFGWLPYILYPEQHVMPLMKRMYQAVNDWISGKSQDTVVTETTCQEDGTCLNEDEAVESDLEMAARYYRLAAEMHKSARANFNLGFVYEWGLGVKQDFPLAKRHYDLARTLQSGEADLAVQIALVAMNVHERLVKLYVAYREWRRNKKPKQEEQIPSPASDNQVGHPVPSSAPEKRTKRDVIISHLLSWESLLIVILTIVLSKLLQHRRTP